MNSSSKNSYNTPKAVQDCHDLIFWMIPQLDKLPRNRRFTLGEKLENRLLEILENLVAAAYSRNKLIVTLKSAVTYGDCVISFVQFLIKVTDMEGS